MALKLRRAEERFIPQSTRAVSFKRMLGSSGISRSNPQNQRLESQLAAELV
jgi:hypothetical protein